MWVIILIRSTLGYLRIEFSGDNIERIFALCAQNRITLWEISKNNEKISACVSINSFRKLRKALRKRKIRAHIIDKIGLPFYLKRHKNRLGFAVGILLFIAILFTLQGRVWNVEISGVNSIDKQEIYDACVKNNIVIGGRKKKINTDMAALDISIEVEGISWAAVNIEGTTVSIEVREENEAEYNKESAPSNLIAAYDGVIKSVEVISGFSLVKPGDSVARDDVLVAGTVELATGATEFVNSSGKIFAQTNRDITVCLPAVREILLPCDSVKRYGEFSFFGIDIPMYFSKYEHALIVSKNHCAHLNNQPLPICFNKKFVLPMKNQEISLTEDELLIEARGRLNRVISALDAKSVEVINEQVVDVNGEFCLTWTISAIENIVYEQNLEFNSSIS